jgi:hypothetical protein
MADQFGSGMGLDPVFVDLLRQLAVGKLGKGAAEGRFAGQLTGALPATELPQHGTGFESVQERTGGGELINVLGDEGLRQPGARTGQRAVAAPFVTAGEAAQIGERNDFAELLIQGGERPQFLRERGKSWRCRWWKIVVRSAMKDRRSAPLPVQTNRKKSQQSRVLKMPQAYINNPVKT